MKPIRLLLLLAIIAIAGCKGKTLPEINRGGHEIVGFRAIPFEMDELRLLDGPFMRATKLNEKTLLGYQPDRFLAKFRIEAGLKQRAEQYYGWEESMLAGHSLGHYLSGLSYMYKTTGNPEYMKRVNYIVGELRECQLASDGGYIGAFTGGRKILETEVAKGNIRSQGFDLNGIWAPFYTMHKIMAGLRDAYHLCGDSTALMVERDFADWINTIIADLDDQQIQEMLKCEHGGISETLIDLYADTDNRKYLSMSGVFYQKEVLDPLKSGEDILPGRHCNTNIPKLIALARSYEITGDTSDRKAAEFFWQTVTRHHTYVTGGNGNDEYFGAPDKLRNRLGEGTTETCNVYNMLKLSNHLFEWSGSAEVADFYERALLNHILSSQNPENGEVVYNLSLDMGGYKAFQDPGEFTCCIGTAMETHSKYMNSVYFHNNDEIFVCQFIASEVEWREKGFTLTQKTAYPEEQSTKLVISCAEPEFITINIRYPVWAKEGFQIKVNDRIEHYHQNPGSFVSLRRKWNDGDIIDVVMPFALRLESMPDDSSRVAVMYGPLVLAGLLGEVNDTASTSPLYVPVLMTSDRDPASWLVPVEGQTNTFMMRRTGRPRDVLLMPFYKIYNKRYTVYWDMFSESDWKEKEESYLSLLEFRKNLEKTTIDFFQPGEMQPERDHNMKGDRTNPGSFKDRPFRETRGGWFSVEMKCDPDRSNRIVAEYWGGFPGAKTFDIIVEGTVIATENISNRKDGEFIFVEYPVPAELTKGKKKVNIRIEAHKGNMAGPLFGLRTVR